MAKNNQKILVVDDEADFRFCGKDRFEDKPYCLDHCAVAYVVPEKEENEKTELNNTI